MENATKALLIAAAVLIAIVLIALGVRLLNSAGDSSDKAQDVANQMDASADSAIDSMNQALSGLTTAATK